MLSNHATCQEYPLKSLELGHPVLRYELVQKEAFLCYDQYFGHLILTLDEVQGQNLLCKLDFMDPFQRADIPQKHFICVREDQVITIDAHAHLEETLDKVLTGDQLAHRHVLNFLLTFLLDLVLNQ